MSRNYDNCIFHIFELNKNLVLTKIIIAIVVWLQPAISVTKLILWLPLCLLRESLFYPPEILILIKLLKKGSTDLFQVSQSNLRVKSHLLRNC